MSNNFEKQPVGFEQPIGLKKIYFVFVCLFCGLISLLIFDVDNYETWAVIPLLSIMLAYQYFFTLNVSNIYTHNGSIIVEYAIKGEFVYDKSDLLDVKSSYFFNKVYFVDTTFYIHHSSGFLKALLFAGEKDYEKEIKRLLLS